MKKKEVVLTREEWQELRNDIKQLREEIVNLQEQNQHLKNDVVHQNCRAERFKLKADELALPLVDVMRERSPQSFNMHDLREFVLLSEEKVWDKPNVVKRWLFLENAFDTLKKDGSELANRRKCTKTRSKLSEAIQDFAHPWVKHYQLEYQTNGKLTQDVIDAVNGKIKGRFGEKYTKKKSWFFTLMNPRE